MVVVVVCEEGAQDTEGRRRRPLCIKNLHNDNEMNMMMDLIANKYSAIYHQTGAS